MHLLAIPTILLALTVVPVFSAPVPHPLDCGADAITFLGPRRRSIMSIRASCDQLRKRAEILIVRDADEPSIAPAVLPMRLAVENIADSVDFEVVSSAALDEDARAPESHKLIISTKVVDADSESSSGEDLADHTWTNEFQRGTREVLFTLIGVPEIIAIAAAIAVLVFVAALLMVEMVHSARKNGWALVPRHWHREESSMRLLPAPTLNEKAAPQVGERFPNDQLPDQR